jgi:ubiquinone/menaquinone biosynthesis C-methylase UbiE
MSDADYLARMLRVANPLREAALRAAIQALQLPWGSRGLDAGCGIGQPALLLAEAVGPGGHVTGLDLLPELLVYAEEIAEGAGLSERISFQQGDVRDIPFGDDTFDWAWSVDCVGHFPLEPLPTIKELARVVKLGGVVAVLGWSYEKLLPGYPVLEARLSATSAGIAPFTEGERPELHFLRTLGWFRDAGLEEPMARTFASEAHAPLTEDLRGAMIALFEMRWPGVEPELTEEDWAEYQRLCLPESPDFIVDHPDYYAFFTHSMFSGKVAQ